MNLRSEVPQEALPRHPWHKGAAVLALAPAHAILALDLGVSKFSGTAGGANT